MIQKVLHLIDNFIRQSLSFSQKQVLNYLFLRSYGKFPDWNHPRDLNEWIAKQALNWKNEDWSFYADKYRVREYIKDCGMQDILVKLYGVWKDPSDIELENLPESFVLKTNNGCGDITIISNKHVILPSEWEQIISNYKKILNKSYGKTNGEFHYSNIKPMIIAEELLDKDKQSFRSSSLIDYKLWFINGEFQICMTIFDRSKSSAYSILYDKNWKKCKGFISYGHIFEGKVDIPRPKNWEDMLELGTVLAKPFKIVRVDFYEVDGKIYFGELTFTSAGCRMKYFSKSFLRELGEKVYKQTT